MYKKMTVISSQSFFQTVEKVVLPQVIFYSIILNVVFGEFDIPIKTARKTSNFPCGYLLFANLNSTVPSYADEFKLTKYYFLFRSPAVCR